jgi:hypothetical protein
MTKRISTKSLVENPAFADRNIAAMAARGRELDAVTKRKQDKKMMRMVYDSIDHLDEPTREEMRSDIHQFYSYFDEIRGVSERTQRWDRAAMAKMYGQMTKIAEKYPQDNVLKNKLDEVERVYSRSGFGRIK